MAVVGTAVAKFDEQGAWKVNIAGITQGGTTQTFTLKKYTASSFGVSGTFGAAASWQWQGTNDDGTTWDNIGLPITQAGGGTLTPNQVFYGLYRAVVTGGDGTTNLAAVVLSVISR